MQDEPDEDCVIVGDNQSGMHSAKEKSFLEGDMDDEQRERLRKQEMISKRIQINKDKYIK